MDEADFTSSVDSSFIIPHSSFVSPASDLAKSQRNCSPLLNTWYGLIQLGGEEKPTAVNRRVISLIGRGPSPSMTA